MHLIKRLSLAKAAIVFLNCIFPVSVLAQDGFRYHVGTWSGTALGQRSSYQTRADTWLGGVYRFQHGNFEGAANVTFDISDDTVSYAGSHAQLAFGDWVAGLGLKERHWSLSPNTSLILSQNAPPLPTLYLTKRKRTAFDAPVLSWIGPWEADIFYGYNDKGDAYKAANMFGARVIVEPISNFEIEAVWTSQFFPEDADFLNIFGSETNRGVSPDANGMAGFGASYSWGSNRVYMQAIGEDEAGWLPSCFMYLAGFSHRTFLRSIPSKLNVELVDTRISETPNGFCGPGMAYRNGTHPYIQKGFVMGATIDSEGTSISFNGSHDFPDYHINWGIAYKSINEAFIPNHRLSQEKADGLTAHLGFEFDFGRTEVTSRVHYQGLELESIGVDEGIGVSVSLNF
jgi:hypothetical protein